MRASVQWKSWSLILGHGYVFLSSFKLSYYITYMRWVSYCMKARKVLFFVSNKYQLPCEIWLQCKWLVWPSVIHSLSLSLSGCMYVCVSTLGTQTTSPAGSQPQVLLEIKQEISALWNKHTRDSQIFWLPVCRQQLHPCTSFFWCVFISLKFS